MTLFLLRFPVCYVFVCVVVLTLFHVCVWKESGCDKKMFLWCEWNVETMCDVKNTCHKSVFPLQWSLGMRWCHQSSVDVIKKMWLFRLSQKWRRTLKWSFDLCRVKLWSLLLRCLEWSIPTYVCLGTSWMARTVKWRLSLGGIFVDLRVCVPELRYGSTD